MFKSIGYFLICFIATTFSVTAQKPQDPVNTSAYISEDVTFKNEPDNITLTGTLTIPKNKTGFPTVILISGSGPQDRNSELLGHKPFLVLADDLTKKGIAVLRVDDRGTGGTEGIYNDTGLDGFNRDTKAAIRYLKSRAEITSSKIGLLGHSLGGITAPMIAAETDDVAFVVMLAGPGISGEELMLLQKENFERKMGVPEAAIASGKKNIAGVYSIIKNSDADRLKLQAEVKAYFTQLYGTAITADQLNTLSEQLTWPWFSDFIKYDPSIILPKVKCPILAINGSNDIQVSAKENLAGIKELAEKANNHNVTVMEFPKLNHLFQESETGLPQEYAKIEQTFSPEVLNAISDWILKLPTI